MMTDEERAYLQARADGTIGLEVGWEEWRRGMEKAHGQIGHVMSPHGGSKEMPRWQSHKTVWALKITKVQLRGRDWSAGATLVPEDPAFGGVVVDGAWLQKHQPTAPFYYVVYEPDGYASVSPVEPFEAGYTRRASDPAGLDKEA